MRRFEFPVDRGHARAVNETLADIRRRLRFAAMSTILFSAAAALLIIANLPWAYILAVVFALAAVTALWITAWTAWRSAGIDKLYRDGELVPTVVAGINPGITLLALVDLAAPDRHDPRYALVTRSIRSLPGHSLTPGERVPAVTVSTDWVSRDSGELRQTLTAMPIAWATRDPSVIDAARAEISDAEWALLTDHLELAAKVPITKTKRLLLDPHQLPKELRS